MSPVPQVQERGLGRDGGFVIGRGLRRRAVVDTGRGVRLPIRPAQVVAIGGQRGPKRADQVSFEVDAVRKVRDVQALSLGHFGLPLVSHLLDLADVVG
jgi:hypothetical protein